MSRKQLTRPRGIATPRGRRAVAFSTAALLAAALGAQAQETVNISGATLFADFFKAPASTSDFIDVDGDGIVTRTSPSFSFDQLAPTDPFDPTDGHWILQYRAVGSGNGLADLVNWWDGNDPATAAAEGEISYPSDPSFVNRTQYANAGALSGVGNAANPGGMPYLSTSLPGGNTGVRIDIAVSDVPSTWFVKQSGTAKWNRAPGDAGYGSNSAKSAAGQSNTLKSLTPSVNTDGPTLDTVPNAGAPTVYDTPIAWVPITFIANHGADLENVKKSELQHLYTTGRLTSGENLVAATRDSGSGTRNGAMNSLGIDPSWGVGDNTSPKNDDSTKDILGSNFQATNKGGSSRMEGVVENHRLAVGYTGIAGGSRSAVDAASGFYEIVNVMNDTAGGNAYVRPGDNDNLVFNGDASTGWQVGGTESFYTVGDPFAGDIYVNTTTGEGTFDDKSGEAGWTLVSAGNGNTEMMQNVQAALYLRNIKASIDNYITAPGDPANNGNPGQFLSLNFTLQDALEAIPDPTNPGNFIANPDENEDLQDPSLLPNITVPGYGSVSYGEVSARTKGVVYSDGVANGNHYVTNDGTAVQYNTLMVVSGADPAEQAIFDRNAIAGDFDGDGDRDKDDIDEMVAAYQVVGGDRTTLSDPNAVLELLGDFNGDGNFDAEDVRYGADGLFNKGRTDDKLDRKQNFIDMDTAFGGNLLGTTLATGSYDAGDSRADVAGNASVTRGAAPTGHDGMVDDQDIDYIFAQIAAGDTDNPFATVDGIATWSNLDEAVFFDLSADMDGDLDVDIDDVYEVVRVILETELGDADLNGIVDDADLLALDAAFGTAAGWAGGDFDGNGIVDDADLLTLDAYFGFGAAGLGADQYELLDSIKSHRLVPEPTSLALLAIAGMAALRRRHGRGM